MTSEDFCRLAKKAADSVTVYATGGIGFNLNYPGQLEYLLTTYNNKKRVDLFRQRMEQAETAGSVCWAFDCICLVKSILWGWTGDTTKPLGGAEYGSNGVPDIDINTILGRCGGGSEDFTDIVPGELVTCGDGGHAGIYIGGGYAVEATTAWDRQVSVSGVLNLLERYPEMEGYGKTRTWQYHARLPWVEYPEEDDIMTKEIVCPCCGKVLIADINLTLAAKPVEDLIAEHVVQLGESPWSIAVKYYGDGNKWEAMMDYNGIPRGTYIHTGDIIKIPRL